MADNYYRMGDIIDIFGFDRKTILARVNLYSAFFSDRAKLEGAFANQKHRTYLEEDKVTLNTIFNLEQDGLSPEEITLKLAEGYRDDKNWPARAAVTDNKMTALAQASRLSLYAQENARLTEEVEELREENKKLIRENGILTGKLEIFERLFMNQFSKSD